MRNYKNFAIFFVGIFGVASLATLALVALLYIYDPFWLFHKPIFRSTTYHSDMRIQAKGIIDNAEFDSLILGSSMLENTSAKEAGQKLGGKWINLSLAGSDFSERKILLNYTLKRKNIKQVIFSIDSYVLLNGDRENSTSWRVDSQLYTEGLFLEKFKRYLNKKFIKCTLRWSKKAECVGDKNDLETIAQTYRAERKYFGGFLFWIEWQKEQAVKQYSEYVKNDFRPKSAETKRLNFDEQKIYLQESVLQVIRENPQIEFYLIFPPYPRFFYALFPFDAMYHKGRSGKEIFAEVRQILPYLAQEVANLDNAKIYGFDSLDYADNIANYIDHEHYYLDMNSMQLDAIANGTHILTPENIDEYLQTMENKIKSYDISPLIKQIQEWEAQRKK